MNTLDLLVIHLKLDGWIESGGGSNTSQHDSITASDRG